MPTQHKPRWRRWTLRVLIVLFAGVLLTIASSWVLQWRAFQTSASQARWRLDMLGRHYAPAYRYLGDGRFEVEHAIGADFPLSTQAAADIHHIPDLPWYILESDDQTNIRRNEWDNSRPIHRVLETPGHPVVPEINLFMKQYNRASTLFDDIKPERAIDPDPLKSEWFWATRYFDLLPGWFAASSFRRSHDESLHALHRPVERWSAQRAGWPMHAMMTEQYAIGPRPPIERVQDMPIASLRHGLRGGLILHHQPQHPMLHPLGHHSLPLMPLWPGFATNTAFYAASIATLWLTIGGGLHLLGTKKRRRKRGLCESCGYDIQGLETCPECGTQSTGRDA